MISLALAAKIPRARASRCFCPPERFTPFSWMPDWMWSYRYPHNVNEVGDKITGCVDAKFCNQLPEGVFPTPFYEVIACFVLFLILWSLRKRLKIPGTIFFSLTKDDFRLLLQALGFFSYIDYLVA